MRRFFLALPLLLGACASGPPGQFTEQMPTQQTVTVTYPDGGSAEVAITRRDFISRAELSGARQDVWNALPDAFQDVGLPLPLLDRARWVGAVQGHRVTQRLGSERLSGYFDCGASATGLNADQRRITLGVYVALERVDSATTQASIRVDAVAHTTEGASSAPMTCSSRGTLENRLAVALQLRTLGGR